MLSEISITLGSVFFLLFFSAFFSGSETALTAVSHARIHQLEKLGNRNARLVSKLLHKRDHMIVSLLLGNNLVNILASAMATKVMVQLFGEAGIIYATLSMTLLVLILAEVTPKIYAASQPERVSLKIVWVVLPFVTLFSPITRIVQFIAAGFMRVLGVVSKPNNSLLSAHEELRGAIDLHHRQGAMIKTAKDMLGGILDLKELVVSDIMVHRTNMIAVNIDDPIEKVISTVISSTHTRIPLWRDTLENIVGILHAKDLARAITEAKGNVQQIDLAAIAIAPWFVPDSTHVHDQLSAFLKRKTHFALVVDEYGEVMGLVTLEDIIEEIVGEIADEHDTSVIGVRPQKDGSVITDGKVAIRDLNRAMDWSLPDSKATTIAGLVIHEARMIPEQGQIFTFHNFRFQVLRCQQNRINLLRINALKPNMQQEEA